LRHGNLSDEEEALQRDLDRSWERAQETLADPVKRAYLVESIERVKASTSSTTLTTLTKDEFLVRTELPTTSGRRTDPKRRNPGRLPKQGRFRGLRRSR
jgi:hypothetical protein